ncbi:DUF2497 domain-containing protein [Pyruvatibacter sp.]|uniref:DUF2497 domain-containing protein n=1 Tax=Pyruvatibacter sp. TaxID=1981328 RepID=UPI0032F013CD
MSDQSTQQEPSMEEILASIRRIISEDGDENGADAKAAAPDAPDGDADGDDDAISVEDILEDDAEDDDVLELTDVAEAPSIPEPEPEPVVAAVHEPEPKSAPETPTDPFDTGDDSDLMAIDRTPDPEPAPKPAPVAMPVSAPRPASSEKIESQGLMSEEAASAATAAFERLSDDMRISSDGTSRTMEDLVQDLLRPMMKQWLDENLASIVEAAVAEEVERVSRRRRR